MNTGRNVGMMGIAVVASTAIAMAMLAETAPLSAGARQDGQGRAASQPQVTARPVLYKSVKHDVSPRMDSMLPIEPIQHDLYKVRINRFLPARVRMGQQVKQPWQDPVAQTLSGLAPMPSPLANFDGVNNVSGVLPPDTQGAVGPNHYVQWVNLAYAVYNKSGTKVFPAGPGFAAGNTIWSGFGGPCATTNDGDPITLYDRMAGRWLMAQFALPNFPNGPFYQCVAVSTSNDPTSTWNRYMFESPGLKMNDYPHFGIWPDGYYMSVNQFASGTLSWAGGGVYAFNRDQMVAGLPSADSVYFDLFARDPNLGGMLPSDLDGYSPPPAGSPNFFIEADDGAGPGATDILQIFKFHVDWTNRLNSTFTGPTVVNLSNIGLGFDSNMCGGSRSCIPQPGTAVGLDAISDRLMYRLAYRNFGDHESLVFNHTVDTNGANHAGIRWYELRSPNATPAVFQAGTYGPDADHRWMGSIAMDGSGDIALGFSVSSGTTFPSIRYVGRLPGDPAGTLPQTEVTMMTGTGSQTHNASRWGDYSSLTLDPTDECTFWYTQEYLATTGIAPWRTRIGSFKFPSCVPLTTPGAPAVLTGSATGSTVTLSWTAPAAPVSQAPLPASPATAYIIEAGSAPGLANLATVNTGNTNTSFVAIGVGNGEYFIRVKATNGAGTSGPSNEVRVVVGAMAPGVPTGLIGGAAGSTLNLAWTAPATGGSPTAYMIEAGSATGLSDIANFSTGNTLTSFSAPGVPNGRYFLRVRATNSGGTSGPSNEVIVVVGPAAPGPPSGLTWSSAGSTIMLAWTAPGTGGAPAAYMIEAGSSTGLANLANFSTGNPATSYAAGGIANGTYFVRVKATNTGGTSGPSNEVPLRVGCTAAPGAPSSLHTNSNSGGTVQFGWTAPNFAATSNGPTTYVLEAGSGSGLSDLAVMDLGSAATTFTVGGIPPGTYFVRVKSRNLCGTSAASNEFTLIVP